MKAYSIHYKDGKGPKDLVELINADFRKNDISLDGMGIRPLEYSERAALSCLSDMEDSLLAYEGVIGDAEIESGGKRLMGGKCVLHFLYLRDWVGAGIVYCKEEVDEEALERAIEEEV